MEQVCHGRLRIEAVLHLGVHPSDLRAVAKPCVAALVDTVGPFEVQWVALVALLDSEHRLRACSHER